MATPTKDKDQWVGPPRSSTAQERNDDFGRSISLSIDPSGPHPAEDPLRARSVSPAGPSSAFVFVPSVSLSRRGGWRLLVIGCTSRCGFSRVCSLVSARAHHRRHVNAHAKPIAPCQSASGACRGGRGGPGRRTRGRGKGGGSAGGRGTKETKGWWRAAACPKTRRVEACDAELTESCRDGVAVRHAGCTAKG